MIRQGECNLCGDCCGVNGVNPWPRIYAQTNKQTGDFEPSFRHWADLQTVIDMWPHALWFGVLNKGDGAISVPDPPYGSTRVTGQGGGLYHYVWVGDVGVCKDTSAGHDGTSYDPVCPFLKDDPGDGTRPCALVGTNRQYAYDQRCSRDSGVPTEKSPEDVTTWQAEHPNCSYTWVAE
jgi:hypothetical protein